MQTGAYALRALALLDEQDGRYALAIDEARRSAALAASVGNSNLRDSARVQEVLSLVHAGRLDEARLEASKLRTTVSNAWENVFSLRYAEALLSWRSCDGLEATSQMSTIADEASAAGLRVSHVARLEEHFQHITLGDEASAQRSLRDLEFAGTEAAVLQARAALALLKRDRAACVVLMREAASVAVLDSADSARIDINLAWLLLEDANWEEVSALVGHIAESMSDALPARILSAAHLLATNSDALADGEWETLVSEAPRLMKHCPWLIDGDAGERIRTGAMWFLPELLTRMCW